MLGGGGAVNHRGALNEGGGVGLYSSRWGSGLTDHHAGLGKLDGNRRMQEMEVKDQREQMNMV
eukprot:688713-Hanusia_phi.AAC.5